MTDADFYCWQHKDQVQVLPQGGPSTRSKKKRTTEVYPLQEKSSIDTLVQKLGIEAVPENIRQKARLKPNDGVRPPRRTATADFAESRPGAVGPSSEKPVKPSSRRKKPGFWTSLCSLCCVSSDNDDYVEIVRHKQRVQHSTTPPAEVFTTSQPARRSSSQLPPRRPAGLGNNTTSKQRTSSNPDTGRLLSLIPQTLPPQTTSSVLAELIKPISAADEDGYIYIFWLTPQSKAPPSQSTSRSLLSPSLDRPRNGRRMSDILTDFSFDGTEEEEEEEEPIRGAGARGRGKKKTIMLKIGRANNVTRRMNEWQRQCGYALNLVRWYPYISSTPATTSSASSPSPSSASTIGYPGLSSTRPPSSLRADSGAVRKVPFVKRVERLIHVELADQQVKRQCEACGKEHREWFEVEASEQGVRNVDACVRRWVEWAEREAAKYSTR